MGGGHERLRTGGREKDDVNIRETEDFKTGQERRHKVCSIVRRDHVMIEKRDSGSGTLASSFEAKLCWESASIPMCFLSLHINWVSSSRACSYT